MWGEICVLRIGKAKVENIKTEGITNYILRIL